MDKKDKMGKMDELNELSEKYMRQMMKDTFFRKEVVIGKTVIKSGKRPVVCVPLMGEDKETLLEHLDKIMSEEEETRIDIVEFRADYYKYIQDLEKLKDMLLIIREKLSDKVLLFTIRSPKEGGQRRDYDIVSIHDINTFVVENKLADMVDVEFCSLDEDLLHMAEDICLDEKGRIDLFDIKNRECEKPAIVQLAKKQGVKIIMSNHDFENTPSETDIAARLVMMQLLGADVAKLAAMPKVQEDVQVLMNGTVKANMKGLGTPIVAMSMGEMGIASRIMGQIYGSSITFGCVGETSAPGQLQVSELNKLLDDIHNCSV